MAEQRPTTMKAVRFHDYGPPSVLAMEEAQRPEPNPGEVLIRVRAAGVNAMDWKVRAGYLKDYMPLQLPHVPGYDLAGTVERTGGGVSDLAVGDDVFGRGSATYAEYAVAPAQAIARKPESLSFEQAATLSIGGVTAWSGLFDVARVEPGQRVLVHGGAGGVGSLAVQLARWKAARVIATTSTANVDYVRGLGADEVIDYTTTRFEEVVRDQEVVFDSVGGDVTERSWYVLKKGGILVVIAGRPDPERAAQLGVRTAGVPPVERARPILERLVELIAAGALEPQVGRTFALAQAGQAHAVAETGHGRGRIVLRLDD
jgi:NADPH:quinone reductase-like Zn-dependent oxidoreductase